MAHSLDSTRPSTTRPWRRRMLALGASVAAALALGAVQSPAHAGTDAEWNRLASCESGQNWSINTGNGYYGGLQFSKGSWDWAGGTSYAAYPHQATREQQIATAERLLDMQHVSRAWPACSNRLGITHAQLQSGSATPPGGSSAPTSRPAPAAASPTETAGTHRVRSGDTLSRIAAQYGVSGGWAAVHAANRDRVSNPNLIRVGQVLRIPGAGQASSAPAATAPSTTSSNKPTGSTVTVRAGDTLWKIAQANGVRGGWSALYAANRARISDPNLIHVGQVLQLP